jgi:peptidylglycine monooxygenase
MSIGLVTVLVLALGAADAGWLFSSPAKEAVKQAEVPSVGQTSTLQMPGVTPTQNESYLCASFELNSDETHYIVEFNPMAEMGMVHHMLLFGCEEPGSEEEVWDCGEMSTEKGRYKRSPTCTSQPDIIYAWARNAPKLDLPKGVGFRVGGGTRNRYLVLQVHYMHAMNQPDFSGVQLSSTTVEQPRTAATLLLVTGGEIQPKTTEQLEVACVVDEPVEIHPFAYRVHTHRHGTKVSGWAVTRQEGGEKAVTLLGERDPQLPQLFEGVKSKSLVIRQRDVIAAQCTIKNNEDHVIAVGPTGEDEMCNFYLMYWVEGDNVLGENTCFSPGPPSYFWSREIGTKAGQ